ncbi:ATP-binding protein [Mucilaginibacter jinjuensis]|uniref:histidine kinase n=1 Tax=Mucilaginibacter jinjuensis TaxID=1176721 RepID=A0ABY7T1X6_9SPHI|nr:ATP-binding protein [Mucilaginibacter jinjuensis]WCT10396.1 ATP-binding protein [Mucilaginibacter jinjuensis]
MSNNDSNLYNNQPFLAGGGSMGEMIRKFDWSKTSLGPPEQWPVELKNMTSMLLTNAFPVLICWGDDFIQIYNDAFRPINGEGKHPQALGGSAKDTYAEIWETIGPMFADVMQGKTHGFPEFMVPLNRNGYIEECYFDFSYSPIKSVDGIIGGILVVCVETTERVNSLKEFQKSEDAFRNMNEEMASANEELATTNEELFESRENLQQLLEELADSESKTRSIVEAAPFPIGVYIGKEMRVVLANKSILDVWGKGYDVIGKLYADILPELDNQAVFTQLDHVFTTGEPFVARNQRLDLVVDGETKTSYFNYNFTALVGKSGEIYGVMNTAADVTDVAIARQKLQETTDDVSALNEELAATNEELAATNEELLVANEEHALINNELAKVNNQLSLAQDELQLAINAASLGTFDLNPVTGRFVGNDLLKSWFGLQPEEEIELHKATDVIDENDRERAIAAIQTSLTYESGGDFDTYYTILNPLNPIPKIVRAKGKALFNDERQPIRLSGVLQDVTEQRKDEQRKNDFIGMVSHELKTPLTSLTAIVQVLNSKLKSSEDNFISGALDKANIQVRKMSSMINGFLNISRLESGKIHLDKSDFNLEVLIENMIAETQFSSPGYLISLSPCNPISVNADPDKIGSVISNLLSNAVKYSQKGTHIEVTCLIKDNGVEISVRDEGIGVKAEDVQHLFDRYYRVNNPNYSHISGFGIGLYLSSEIIRQHRGEIWVESTPGKGSTFYFSIPLK